MTLAKENRAAEMGRFARLFRKASGICWGLDGDGPRFRPPEGSFVNFLAKMAESVSRYRCAKSGAMAQRPRNPPRGTNSPLYSTGGSGAANDGLGPRLAMYSEQLSQ